MLKCCRMHKTVVINVVGLTPALLGDATPHLNALATRGRQAAVREILPAVTCSVQATYLTGKLPQDHGIVGNGWYDRADAEVKFWKQSSHLVQAERLWDTARAIDPTFTVANINWWHAMYTCVNATVTPRPMYRADGRKLPDIWTHPASLRDELQAQLGQFPLFQYWGPTTSIESTRWLASAAIAVDQRDDPTLTLVYLPHLDYNLQRFGPDDPRIRQDLADVDSEVGRLLTHFRGRGSRVVVVSEYGIQPVARPMHLNRVLRERGLLTVRSELGNELLDAGASSAFAVADHQVAHVYVHDRAKLYEVAHLIADTPGVARVYVGDERKLVGLNHTRAGDVVAVAKPDSWFTYYYWLDDRHAPDFARTVDIHRKPGYDPCELFINPNFRLQKLSILGKLMKRKIGLRSVLDVIPLDASLVRGSHGLPATIRERQPVFMTDTAGLLGSDDIDATDVRDLLLRHLTD
jgi:predicted AlkP superfamily pyrophosphatase or phosphodiesterase